MALTCNDIDKLIYPYLDGEFSDEDRDAVDVHLERCEACRTCMASERRFKSDLRSKLPRPKPGSDLQARMLASLDEVDALEHGSMPLWEGLLHRGAMVAAAAAVALFALYPRSGAAPAHTPPASALVGQRSGASPPLDDTSAVNALVQTHLYRPLDVRAAGQVPPGVEGQVGVRFSLPRFAGTAQLRGAAVNDLGDRRSAQFVYATRDGGGRDREFSVHVFDPSGMKVPHSDRRVVRGINVVAGQDRGYNYVFYRKDGVGYAYISDLPTSVLYDLVDAELAP